MPPLLHAMRSRSPCRSGPPLATSLSTPCKPRTSAAHGRRTVFESMLSEIHRLPSYDGGDQGFLNSFFHLWYDSPAANRLPIAFNVVQNFAHDEPTWRMITPDARVVHFCGQHEMKPWSQNNSFSNLVAPFIWIWRQHFAHRTDHARLLGASPHFMFSLCHAIFLSSHKIAEWFP